MNETNFDVEPASNLSQHFFELQEKFSKLGEYVSQHFGPNTSSNDIKINLSDELDQAMQLQINLQKKMQALIESRSAKSKNKTTNTSSDLLNQTDKEVSNSIGNQNDCVNNENNNSSSNEGFATCTENEVNNLNDTKESNLIETSFIEEEQAGINKNLSNSISKEKKNLNKSFEILEYLRVNVLQNNEDFTETSKIVNEKETNEEENSNINEEKSKENEQETTNNNEEEPNESEQENANNNEEESNKNKQENAKNCHTDKINEKEKTCTIQKDQEKNTENCDVKKSNKKKERTRLIQSDESEEYESDLLKKQNEQENAENVLVKCENGDGNDEENENLNIDTKFGKIKVVDINKLLDPKAQNSRTKPAIKQSTPLNSDSILIISDSDDELPAKRLPRRAKQRKQIIKASITLSSEDELAEKEKNSKKEKENSKVNKNKKRFKKSKTSSSSNEDAESSKNKENKKKKVITSSSDSSSDDDTASNKNKEKSKENKKKKVITSSSDSSSDDKGSNKKKSSSSSSSDDSSSNMSKIKNKQKKLVNDKNNKEKKRSGAKKQKLCSSDEEETDNEPALKKSLNEIYKEDPKFSWKSYVKVTRRKPEKMVERYKKALEDKFIDKLTNLGSLENTGKKRSRVDSSSSLDEEGASKKAEKTNNKKAKEADFTDESSDSDGNGAIDNTLNILEFNEEDAAHSTIINQDAINESILDAMAQNTEKNSDKTNNTDNEDEEQAAESTEKNDKSSESEKPAAAKKPKNKTKAKKHSSDEESDTELENKKKGAKPKTTKKKRRKVISDSESEKESESSEGSDEAEKTDKEEDESPKKKKRSRIKKISSDEDNDEEKSTRKQIRKVWSNKDLENSTIQAGREEEERKARIAEKQKKYNNIFNPDMLEKDSVDKVVLDFDEETNEELLSVHEKLVKHLKPHQAGGIQFMWNSCFESIKRIAKDDRGSGCILGHCMGLGKTLQIITLVHTLITNSDKTRIEKVLVVCPLSTVLNWKSEFKKWLPEEDDFEVYEIASVKSNAEREYAVKHWHDHGGAFILGYDMFRNLTNETNKRMSKKMRATFQKCLVNPGPDLVVCDEGHLLKNEKTSLSMAMNKLKTARRIVLTGTPLQNNLREYYCMVQFVKPNLLGTFKEYSNRFVNPITNGQYTDSTDFDIQLMRRRSHVLHKMLDGVIQRRDYAVLAPFLPPKLEYVIFISVTDVQKKLYEHYLQHFARKNSEGSKKTSSLFCDFQALQRICTHPRVLLDKSNEMKKKREMMFDDEESEEGSLKDFIDDGESSAASTSSDSDGGSIKSGSSKKSDEKKPPRRRTRATAADFSESDDDEKNEPQEWWEHYCPGDELDNIANSGKLLLLFQILKECEIMGDKVLIFSQSLYALNCIEYFLQKVDEATQAGDTEKTHGFGGSWSLGLDYYRLDGSMSCDSRAVDCKNFNDPNNTRARLFLISTRAGGLGINLVAANRVIIFDVSWNPSHDIQSIYRVYRFGQTKPTYVYRFVTYGSMEMKVYERQVTKQAISKRVIDEQQIDRHYNQNDLAELYNFEANPPPRPTPLVPKDVLLAEMLQNHEKLIYKYHEHQSLLENKEEETLNEEERKAAWEEFENEKKARPQFNALANIPVNLLYQAIASLIKRDNPTWDNLKIQTLLPNLVKEITADITGGNMLKYQRIVNEIRLLQQQQQQLQQLQMQQAQTAQFMQYYQQLFNTTMGKTSNNLTPPAGGSTSRAFPNNPTEIIDLND